ncbi:hypothetical protein [Dongia sp.]|uniref:hypothetical protein n=1 Tax=Dongia sp. TaxID=1977262 RepID=UPI0035AFAB4B
MSDPSLKDGNKIKILTILVANLIVYYLAVKTDALFATDWSTLANSLVEGAPAGILLILSGIANAQLSPMAKARISFLRWNDPLPGSRAFSHYAQTDPRIDPAALAQKYGTLPTDPKDQNRLWYKMYKSIENEAAVLQVHREYLFTRDYNGLALLMLIGLGIAGVIQIPSLETAGYYAAILLAQFWFTGQAARHHGQRFVTTVLARCGAKE